MGIFDKVKNFIDNSDEDTIDEDIENVYDDSADDTYSSAVSYTHLTLPTILLV